MRSVWSGVISFGLVNIPVGMYPATKENQVSFHLLHKKDCGRIKNQRVCTECGEILDYDDLIKGYEYKKDHYVEVTKEEFKQAQSEQSDAITIKGFVDLDDIDPIYFDSPYYLTPGKHGERAYALLRQVLQQSGKAGIASFVLRTKEYLAAVRVKDNALLLNTMHFADEVREIEGVPGDVEVEKEILEMSLKLVEAMSGEFEAEKYKDHYNETLLDVINRKLEGKPVEEREAAPPPTNVLDMMARLKESLERAETADSPTKTQESRNGSHKNGKNGSHHGGNGTAIKTMGKPAAKSKAKTKSTRGKAAKKPHLRMVA